MDCTSLKKCELQIRVPKILDHRCLTLDEPTCFIYLINMSRMLYSKVKVLGIAIFIVIE